MRGRAVRRRFLLTAAAALGTAIVAAGALPAHAGTDRGTFRGRLVDEAGRPVADAVVSVWTRFGADNWLPTANAGTDADGRYAVDAQAGEHRLRFQWVNYVQYAPRSSQPSAATTFPLAAGADVTVDERLLSPARLSGTLRDTAGDPVPDLRVVLNGPADPAVAEAATGPDGRFDFGPTSPGTYQLLFLLRDGRRQYWPGTFDPDAAESFTLTLGHAREIHDIVAE